MKQARWTFPSDYQFSNNQSKNQESIDGCQLGDQNHLQLLPHPSPDSYLDFHLHTLRHFPSRPRSHSHLHPHPRSAASLYIPSWSSHKYPGCIRSVHHLLSLPLLSNVNTFHHFHFHPSRRRQPNQSTAAILPQFHHPYCLNQDILRKTQRDGPFPDSLSLGGYPPSPSPPPQRALRFRSTLSNRPESNTLSSLNHSPYPNMALFDSLSRLITGRGKQYIQP